MTSTQHQKPATAATTAAADAAPPKGGGVAAPPSTLPNGSGAAPPPSRHRLSCTACSAPGNNRYAAASQQASPASSRRNSHLKTLTPPSNPNSSQDSLITHKSSRNNTTNNNSFLNSPHSNKTFDYNPLNHNNNHSNIEYSPHNYNSNIDYSPHRNYNSLDNTPYNDSNSSNPNLTLDLPHLASSSSLQASGFNLKFNTHHSQPKIKCHIDHLHRDLELDVKLDGYNEDNNEMSHNNSSRFTLNCYNPDDPDKNIKLRVELIKTSAKGFGLKIIQHTPHSPSFTDSSNEASLVSKKEKSKRNKSDHSDSRRNSIRSESSSHIPRSNDFSESDEVRISSGKLSRAGDDTSEDHCKCSTPCGAPGCKATELPKEHIVNL